MRRQGLQYGHAQPRAHQRLGIDRRIGLDQPGATASRTPSLRHDGVEPVAQPERVAHGDQPATRQLGDRHDVESGQRVVMAQHGDAWQRADPVHPQAAMLERQAAGPQLHRAGQHSVHHLLGRGGTQLDRGGAATRFDRTQCLR